LLPNVLSCYTSRYRQFHNQPPNRPPFDNKLPRLAAVAGTCCIANAQFNIINSTRHCVEYLQYLGQRYC